MKKSTVYNNDNDNNKDNNIKLPTLYKYENIYYKNNNIKLL